MSNNIKQIRKEQGISVTELAAKLNMSQSNLTKIENGQIELRPDTAEKIAAALNISPRALQNHPAANGTIMLDVLNPEALSLPPLSGLPIPACMLQSIPENAALFAVSDDTMAPQIPSGSLVIIDKSIKDLISDGIYLLQIGQNIVLRRLQQTFSTTVNILCNNQFYIPQQIYISSINIIGRAVLAFGSKPL